MESLGVQGFSKALRPKPLGPYNAVIRSQKKIQNSDPRLLQALALQGLAGKAHAGFRVIFGAFRSPSLSGLRVFAGLGTWNFEGRRVAFRVRGSCSSQGFRGGLL